MADNVLKPAGLVSEQVLEYLLTEISNYAAKSCAPEALLDQEDHTNDTNQEKMTVAAEMAAAKLERMGWSVGYRWTERLSQNKTWNAVVASSAASSSGSASADKDEAAAAVTAAQQLEAVKFLCKEVWMEIFRKQIDKLQTNHRGVFVLKDLELKWLSRFPSGPETSRVAAMRLLSFPCGLIRGSLANLGIPAVVSCDFLADGQHMSACNFNIKVK